MSCDSRRLFLNGSICGLVDLSDGSDFWISFEASDTGCIREGRFRESENIQDSDCDGPRPRTKDWTIFVCDTAHKAEFEGIHWESGITSCYGSIRDQFQRQLPAYGASDYLYRPYMLELLSNILADGRRDRRLDRQSSLHVKLGLGLRA
jgi:hypothetical protein